MGPAEELSTGYRLLCGRSRATVHCSFDGSVSCPVAELGDAAAIAVGSDFVCARTAGAALLCARVAARPPAACGASPLAVLGPPESIDAVVVGERDACVRARGTQWWCARGPDEDALLTLRRDVLALRPQPMLRGAEQVMLEDDGVGCARWPEGAVRCWGAPARGGDLAFANTPVRIRGLADVTALAAGRYHTCALTRGEVLCWGELHAEPTGRGPAPALVVDAAPRPRRLALPGRARAIASAPGVDVTYVAIEGAVWRHDGIGATVARPLPASGAEGDPVVALAASSTAVCARRASGVVTCWGPRPWPWNHELRAARVPELEGFQHLDVGDDRLASHYDAVHATVCAWSDARGGRCLQWDHEASPDPRPIDVPSSPAGRLWMRGCGPRGWEVRDCARTPLGLNLVDSAAPRSSRRIARIAMSSAHAVDPACGAVGA